MELEKVTKTRQGGDKRRYDDACGLAHALDLIGERWGMLVLRELAYGPRRFSGLKADLSGISANVLTQEKFSQFTPRSIADATASSEVLLCLSAESRESVDLTLERAVAAGGTADPSPKQDYGVMYGRSVADPDGHIWEIMWMDPAAAEQGASAVQDAIATAL